MKATPGELDLHKRLLAKDETASSELINTYLTSLVKKISQFAKYQSVQKSNPEIIWDSVCEALFNYIRNPMFYNPGKASLEKFLLMSADGDLKNAIAKEARHQRRKENFSTNVELSVLRGNNIKEGKSVDQNLLDDELWRYIKTILTTDVDRALVRLILDGERQTEQYAKVLKISSLSLEEQRKEVKKAKDRIKVRLKRAGWEGYLDKKNKG